MKLNLMRSAATFKECTLEKISFIALNQLDLGLTLLAISSGLSELNPLMRNMFLSPYQLILFKVAIPLFLAWIVPGKLLIPAIIFLAIIVSWDIKELMVFYF
jgi:hypothetical protein